MAPCCPTSPCAAARALVVALADGIGSSPVSQGGQRLRAQLSEDYYATSDAGRCAARPTGAGATNAWLHAQTMRSHAL